MLVAVRFVINETSLADWMIQPLLTSDTSGQADLIVVPGAGVVGECTPNINGVRRVVLAAREYRRGRAPAMLITGGGDDSECPIAVAMARFAEEMGVPASKIYIEPSSRSTKENAERSLPLLDALGARRLLVVTDRLHMSRAEQAFAHHGFATERASVSIYEGHPDNVDMLHAGIRESLALVYYRMRGWLQAPDGPRPTTASRPKDTRSSPISSHGGSIVLLGASYAAGWTLENAAGHAVLNRGVGGDETSGMVARFERDVAEAQPHAVVLWGFINDIFRASGEIDPVLARIRDHYTKIIALARARGIAPVLATEVTIRPRSESFMDGIAELVGTLRGKEAYQDRINQHVMTVNKWIVETAAREGLLVLDFQAVLSEAGGRRHKPFAQPDGSHITPAGYVALTAYAAPLLEEHFRAR